MEAMKFTNYVANPVLRRSLAWFFWFPRMTSDKVLIVSVRMSAGIPLAIKMSHSLEKRPQDWIVFWQLIVT